MGTSAQAVGGVITQGSVAATGGLSGAVGGAVSAGAVSTAATAGAGAAAASSTLGISLAAGAAVNAALQPFLDPQNVQVMQAAVAVGDQAFNRVLHRLSPIRVGQMIESRDESGSPWEFYQQDPNKQDPASVHPAYKLLEMVMVKIAQDPVRRAMLIKARDTGDLSRLKRDLKFQTEIYNEMKRVVPDNVWEAAVNSALREPEMEPPKPEKREWSFTLTNDQKRKLAAVVLSEADILQRNEVTYIYLNAIEDSGFENAMARSNPYRRKNTDYKFWLTVAGDTTFQADRPPNWSGIRDFDTNREAVDSHHPDVDAKYSGISQIVKHAIEHPEDDPNPDWIGQGSIDDLNGDLYKFVRARQYYWLQKNGIVVNEKVKILPAQNGDLYRTVIWDEKFVLDYFRKHPNMFNPPVPKVP
jgi:hypothetical protein